MDAEYISLSPGMHDLIPLRALLLHVMSVTLITIGHLTTYSTVFEDNKRCVDLIKALKMNTHTQHIAIKYHHFSEYIHQGHICIQWIDHTQQIADIFTKPLPESKFTFLHE